ncbi:hypothetical protein Tco_1504792 [Tanacetum coccineum]
MIHDSVLNGPLILPTIEVDGVTRPKPYEELFKKKNFELVVILKPPTLFFKVFHLMSTLLSISTKWLNKFGTELGDDLNACLNKLMAFMSTVMASSFPSTNNQLRIYSNPRNQATIQDGRCTQPKRPRNSAWFKEKMLLVQAHESSQTDDLDAYNSDCDDISSAKAVLRANLSSYDSDVLSDVSHHETY